jgi:hypothetical protein
MAGRSSKGDINLYLSVVSSETGKRLTMSDHNSRHYALKIIQELLNLFPQAFTAFLCP